MGENKNEEYIVAHPGLGRVIFDTVEVSEVCVPVGVASFAGLVGVRQREERGKEMGTRERRTPEMLPETGPATILGWSMKKPESSRTRKKVWLR